MTEPRNIVLGKEPSAMEIWVARYMRHRFLDEDNVWFPCAKMHREFLHLWDNPKKYPKVVYVAPRGFYKSSFAEVAVVYDAVHGGPEVCKEHLVLGASQPLANDRLKNIKRELTENEQLLNEYSEGRSFEGPKWTDDEVILTNGVRIVARGRGTSMRGLHPESVLADDLEKEGDSGKLSPTEVENIRNWFRGTVVPMVLSKRGRIWVQGNFLGYDSFLHKAYRGKDWGGKWFQVKHDCRVDNKSSWPERFSDEWLAEQEATMGVLKFAAEMLNDPLASENPVILREWIKYFTEEQVPPQMFKVASFDPAQSMKERADYSAWCVIGADVSKTSNQEAYYVLDGGRGHWDLDERIRRIFDINERYRPDVFRIENNAFQNDMVIMIEKEMQRKGIILPIERVRKGKGGYAKDKLTALDSVSPLVKLGNVRFRKSQEDFIDELLAFPNVTNDDRVDAFTMALDRMKHRWSDRVTEYARKHYRPCSRPEPAIAELGY